MLQKTLESPLDGKEIKPVNPKGNRSWIFIRRTDAAAEVPIRWLPDANSQLFRKDPDAEKDWRHDEKGMTKDEMLGSHHWLDGHKFEQALRDSKGQGSLTCFSPWCCQELDTTERLKNTITIDTMYKIDVCVFSHSVMFHSCDPWDCRLLVSYFHGIFPGKNVKAGCHFLLQGIVLIQGSNLNLLQWQASSFPLCHLEIP